MYKILKNIDFKMSGIDIKPNKEKIIKFTNIKSIQKTLMYKTDAMYNIMVLNHNTT